jgi:FkbM family methyltransferase
MPISAPACRVFFAIAILCSQVHNARYSCKTAYGFKFLMNIQDFTNRKVFEGAMGSVEEYISDLPKDAALLDIGANQGAISLLAAKEENRRVVAFEPSPKAFALLKKNIELNEFTNIIAENSGIVAACMKRNLDDSDANHSGGAHISQVGTPIRLRTVTKNDLIDWNVADRPLYIKIDTEGYELSVLQGLAQLLDEGVVEAIIVEINRSHLGRYSTEPEDIYQFMYDRGYSSSEGPRSEHYDEVFRKAAT